MQQRILNLSFKQTKEYVYLFAGAFIIAVAFNLFMNDFNIASGGVSGISVIVEDVLHIKPAYTQWGLNILFVLLGFVLLGRQFGLKTIIGTLVLPFFVLLTENWRTITDEPLLAALFGGVGLGLGLGLVFRGQASTGGTDLVAQIIHKYTGLSLGVAILLIDGIVVTTAGVVYGPEQALYAIIALFTTGRTIDLVQVGLGYAKLSFIISDQEEAIREAILHHLDRGVTRLSGYGGYTNQSKSVLLCVVEQKEIARLKELVTRHDPDAFVIVSDTAEVMGEGFRRY
ncbi:MAG: YitT family protein [Bacillaceae bacterium]|nr:YitT family protein [Bacillaceae bacterium]